MKLTILELTPCADSIYHIRRDADEGYIRGDGRAVILRSGAKLRPALASTYAGGKATNVARVIDRLLNPSDEIDVELVVFRPDSPGGRYIHELQTSALSRVRVLPIVVDGSARFCVDLADPSTDPNDRVEFNISPRAVWKERAVEVAFEFVSRLSTDLLILAGNPPLVEPSMEMAVDIYSRILEEVRARVEVVSIDTEKATLARCLQSSAQTDVIKINHAEFNSVDADLWESFAGTLVVTDSSGCSVRDRAGSTVKLNGASVREVYSTVGAGDAVHAGFTLARWVWGFDSVGSARYGLAAAAAAISSPEGTRGVDKQTVEDAFGRLERNR